MKDSNFSLRSKKLLTTSIILLLIILAFAVFFFVHNNISAKNNNQKYTTTTTTTTTTNNSNASGFYTKIKNKEKINILVIGDSIGDSDGVNRNQAWFTSLSNWFKSEYNIDAKVKLKTHPGGGVINGLKEYSKDVASGYDLIIVCYGQNDRAMDINTWSVLYETLLRRAIKNNPNAEVIPLIESSFQNYETIPNAIKKVSNYYKLPYIDVRTTFKESGIDYSKLAPDGVHSNVDGYNLYFKAISKQIKKNVSNNKTVNYELKNNLCSD